MEYTIVAGFNWTTNDMGIADSGRASKRVPAEKVVPGYNLLEAFNGGYTMTVVSIDSQRLVFEFQGERQSVELGHTWHSPLYRMDNPYICETNGFFLTFKKKDQPKERKKDAQRVLALLERMRKNADGWGYAVWKNIPLAKEYYDLLHNRLPVSGRYIDATGIIACCDAIFLEHLLETRDVPRLCLEFLQLRKQALEYQREDDEPIDPQFVLGVPEAERLQNELDLYIDPDVDTRWWVDYVGAHLMFDPVERSPQWEEHIYEVEKECDRRLKGVPRGMGFCFAYWSAKEKVLKKHGIEWQTPTVMNPGVMFD